jgi:hypothetical protein
MFGSAKFLPAWRSQAGLRRMVHHAFSVTFHPQNVLQLFLKRVVSRKGGKESKGAKRFLCSKNLICENLREKTFAFFK